MSWDSATQSLLFIIINLMRVTSIMAHFDRVNYRPRSIIVPLKYCAIALRVHRHLLVDVSYLLSAHIPVFLSSCLLVLFRKQAMVK